MDYIHGFASLSSRKIYCSRPYIFFFLSTIYLHSENIADNEEYEENVSPRTALSYSPFDWLIEQGIYNQMIMY